MAHDASKTHARMRSREGAITLVALCMMTALGIGLGSYLSLCSRSAQYSGRQLNQEKAQQLAQAGLEEALWALNQNNWTSSGPDGSVTWSISGADRTATLNFDASGSPFSGQVALTIANYASAGPTWPIITSAATVTLPSGQTFAKSLQAATGPVPLFGNAIASAESYVSFAAGGMVDSWNSDPDNNPATPAVSYSFTAGNPSNHAAVIAAQGNGTYGVVLTQASVRGYVTTFGLPVSYSTSGFPAASVTGPATPAAVKVDSSRLGKSAFVPASSVFSVTLPAINGANYGGLVNNALALASALLSPPPTGDVVYKTTGSLAVLGVPLIAPSITFDRPTKLIVDGDLTIAALGQITVTAAGSLEIFVAGDVTIGGLGMNNLTNDAKKLAIFCTSSSTDTLEYNTTQDFCGVIYCEHKPIDIRQNATFRGALLSRRYVRFSANATAPVFHYDLALRQVRFANVTTPYLIKRLIEL